MIKSEASDVATGTPSVSSGAVPRQHLNGPNTAVGEDMRRRTTFCFGTCI